VKKLSEADREEAPRRISEALRPGHRRTPRHTIDDARERMQQAWESFQEMKDQGRSSPPPTAPSVKMRTASGPLRLGRVLPRRMVRSPFRDLLEQVRPRGRGGRARAHDQELKGQKQKQGDQAGPQVVSASSTRGTARSG